MNITLAKCVLIALSVIVALALFYVYQRTAIGRSMRAVSFNRIMRLCMESMLTGYT